MARARTRDVPHQFVFPSGGKSDDDGDPEAKKKKIEAAGGDEENRETPAAASEPPSFSPVTDKMILEDATGEKCSLPCRSIRVGSYKSMPKEKAVFTEKGIHIRVPEIIHSEFN